MPETPCEPLAMAGRYRSDQSYVGTHYHAVPVGSRGGHARALCGAGPKPLSLGWLPYPGHAVTCPGCLKKLAQDE